MQPPTETAKSNGKWIYVSLAVFDNGRKIKPTQVSFDHVRFAQPPRLTSNKIEIVLVNGDEEQRSWALVLPHEPDATRIPIQLVGVKA
jgi:hypothetical protein